MNRVIFTLILLVGFACPTFADAPDCGTLQNPMPCTTPRPTPPDPSLPQPTPPQGPAMPQS